MSEPLAKATAYLVIAKFNRNLDFWFGGVFESSDEAIAAWDEYALQNEEYDVQFLDLVEIKIADCKCREREVTARLRT